MVHIYNALQSIGPCSGKKMAKLLLLLLYITVHGVSGQVYTICSLLFRDGSCYPGFQCPTGTTQQVSSFFSWMTCDPGHACCTGTPTVQPSTCENDPVCGQWGPTARLAFSNSQTPKQAPWQASICRIDKPELGLTLNNCFHMTGGVLVQNKWVLTDVMGGLTAGRQWPNETWQNTALVVLGDYNTAVPEVYNNVPQEQIRRIKSVSFHPAFRYGTETTLQQVFQDSMPNNPEYFQSNAFCLLELEEPVEYNDWVRPICLPPVTQTCGNFRDCRVTGWGIDENENVKDILQVAYVEQFGKAACEAIDFYSSGQSVNLPTGTKCALNTDKTTACVGDFGGPLVCDDISNSYRATLSGVMTFNLLCNAGNTVLVSDVSSNVVDWIWSTCRSKQG